MQSKGTWLALLLVLASPWMPTEHRASARPAAALVGMPNPVPVTGSAGTRACVGDCRNECRVTIAALLTMVNIALHNAELAACAAGDSNGDQMIAINELVAAVRNALDGCDATCVTATATATSAPMPSATPTTCPDMTGTWTGTFAGSNLGTWSADLTQAGTAVTGRGTVTFPFLGQCSNSIKFCRATVPPCANGGECVIPYSPTTEVIGTNVCGVMDLGFRDVIGFIGQVSGDLATGTYTDPDFGVGTWVGRRQ